jgi:internalin A
VAPGFVIEESSVGRMLVVTGAWSTKAEALVAEGAVDGLVLNYARGFEGSDLEFLAAWPLRHLLVLDRGLRDLSPVGKLGATLESLSVEGAPGVPVDLGDLPHLRRLWASWRIVEATFHKPEALADATLINYHASDLTPLGTQPTLQELAIQAAPLLESLDAVDNLPYLQRLQVVGARHLIDLSALTSLADSLVDFEVQSCLAADPSNVLGNMRQLRRAGINDCGRIETIRPLAELQDLRVFQAWESTRVLDNDLSPLLTLPKLSEIRMRDRRDYKPRVSEIRTLLAARA